MRQNCGFNQVLLKYLGLINYTFFPLSVFITRILSRFMSNPIPDGDSNQNTGQVEIFLYRAPKRNHDALVKINRHSHDFFMKYGVLKFEVFNLTSRDDMMDFSNLAKIISASEDEDVWLEIQSYRDTEHVKEFVKAMEGDKSGDEMYQEFMKLISPGSIVTFGDFNKLKEIS
jgi:hypothetical protein